MCDKVPLFQVFNYYIDFKKLVTIDTQTENNVKVWIDMTCTQFYYEKKFGSVRTWGR